MCVPLAALVAAAQDTPPQSSLPDMGKMPTVPSAARAQVQPQYVIVLDAAHGGNDIGARVSDKLLEKDLSLGFSIRLRQALASHGIQIVTTRDTDTAVSMLTRAEKFPRPAQFQIHFGDFKSIARAHHRFQSFASFTSKILRCNKYAQ